MIELHVYTHHFIISERKREREREKLKMKTSLKRNSGKISMLMEKSWLLLSNHYSLPCLQLWSQPHIQEISLKLQREGLWQFEIQTSIECNFLQVTIWPIENYSRLVECTWPRQYELHAFTSTQDKENCSLEKRKGSWMNVTKWLNKKENWPDVHPTVQTLQSHSHP